MINDSTLGKIMGFGILSLILFNYAPADKPALSEAKSVDIDVKTITSGTDVIDLALKSRGLTRATARLDPKALEQISASEAMIQPNFLRYWKNPFEFPKFAYQLLDAQTKAVASKGKELVTLLTLAQAQTGHPAAVRSNARPELKLKKEKPVQNALQEMAQECRPQGDPVGQAKLSEQEQSGLDDILKNIPAELQLQIAKLIIACTEAKYYRDRALRNLPKEKWQLAFDCITYVPTNQAQPAPKFADTSLVHWELGPTMDYDELYAGAAISLKAISELEEFLSARGGSAFGGKNPKIKPQSGAVDKSLTPTGLSAIAFEINTPLGKIAFNGKNEDDIYQGEDYLAIIDMGGNDTYKGAAAASYKLDHPISVIIDMAGDDTYLADNNTLCSQGAGVMGYGFLIDNGGSDTFTAVNNAQGLGYFGVGILRANGGDDEFKGHTAVQGAAFFGVGLLVKIDGQSVPQGGTLMQGDDSYHAYYTSQGFGFVGGCGVLIDTGGDDKYLAEPYILVHAAVNGHDDLRNYSFCQGAGWGQRDDRPGGRSMGGGTGILQDLAGNDSYECGVFGQAVGYWYGTGILHDKSGNDHYEGSFFVQSGTAHMGLTMLLDEAGDDIYRVWKAISLAGAHDFSVSFLIDKGGNDSYSAWSWKDKDDKRSLKPTGTKGGEGGVLMGSSITNSIAIHINKGGNDNYEFYTKESFAWSNQSAAPNSFRYNNFNLALFIDIGGEDTYNTIVEKDVPAGFQMPKNNSCWSRIAPSGNPDKTFGMGIDASVGKVPEAER